MFHDYGIQANGHGNREWFKHQRDRFRQASIVRAKTILQIPGGEPDANDRANLGLYGLGKRRSLKQLDEFSNVDLKNKVGNVGSDVKCIGHEWVPYDTNISPQENLYNNPDNLDPQVSLCPLCALCGMMKTHEYLMTHAPVWSDSLNTLCEPNYSSISK